MMGVKRVRDELRRESAAETKRVRINGWVELPQRITEVS